MATPFDALTFVERGAGFHYIAPPPTDLGDPARLASSDPDEVALCGLERLKAGDWSVLDRLARLLDESDDAAIWMAVGHLLAHAAPWSWLAHFERSRRAQIRPETDAEGARWLVHTLTASMGLWVVDPVLAIYRHVEDDATLDYLEIYLSRLLETERGEIFAGRAPPEPAFDPEAARTSVEAYCERVLARRAEIEAAAGSETPVIEGEPFWVATLARRLLDRVRRGEDSERINLERMVFEANTGADCTAFFDPNGKLQPLSAAAIIEGFLDSGAASRFRPSVRYFFGHPIPD